MAVIRLDALTDNMLREQVWHLPCRAATTANITISTALNNGDTLDGVTLATGDRVLVKNQSTGAQNGIYIVGATPERAYDMLAGIQARGSFVWIISGTANGQKLYKNTNTTLPTIDTDALTFTEFSGGGSGSVATDTIWDAKGDLAAATGADAAVRVPVGSNDTILMADSAQTAGLKWVGSQTPSTQAFGDAAAEGTADTYARGDHKHAMPAAPVTIANDTFWGAKGDLAAATGNDAASRLAVGSDGLVLVADSSQATGLKWAAAGSTDNSGFTVIVSTANEDITNQQYQNHSEFAISVTANKHYLLEIAIAYSGSDATGDYGWRFEVDAGTQKGRGNGTGLSTGLVGEAQGYGANSVAATGNVAEGTPADVDFIQAFQGIYAFVPSNTTTFRFKFGNFSAGSGRISRTWAGSIMKWKQLD